MLRTHPAYLGHFPNATGVVLKKVISKKVAEQRREESLKVFKEVSAEKKAGLKKAFWRHFYEQKKAERKAISEAGGDKEKASDVIQKIRQEFAEKRKAAMNAVKDEMNEKLGNHLYATELKQTTNQTQSEHV